MKKRKKVKLYTIVKPDKIPPGLKYFVKINDKLFVFYSKDNKTLYYYEYEQIPF